MYKIQPWKHQLEAIERAKDLPEFALFFEQGAGKTSTLINILRDKFIQHRKLLSTLILCPQIVIDNWKSEWLAHSEVDPNSIVCLKGTGYERLAKLKRETERNRDKIIITNYETLYMKNVYESLLAWSPEVLVLDESQKCKDITSKRTKHAIKLSKNTTYRYLLSGTPILKNPFDVFSQYLILDRGESFTGNYSIFRSRYFVDFNAGMPRHTYFPNWVITPEGEREINAIVYKKAMRVKKSECLDLPPFVRQQVCFDLEPGQKRFYDKMLHDGVVYEGSKEITADLAIKKGLRLQQITTGHVSTDDGSLYEFQPNPRIRALEEVLASIDDSHKIIIWAVFKQNYKDVARLLASKQINYTEVTGETPSGEKSERINAFNRKGGPRVLIGHPASCGIGANLTSASYAIFYSRDFSLENDLQAEARNYRGGSEIHERVTRIDIVAKDTIDEVVLKALADKQEVSETILKYVRRI